MNDWLERNKWARVLTVFVGVALFAVITTLFPVLLTAFIIWGFPDFATILGPARLLVSFGIVLGVWCTIEEWENI